MSDLIIQSFITELRYIYDRINVALDNNEILLVGLFGVGASLEIAKLSVRQAIVYIQKSEPKKSST